MRAMYGARPRESWELSGITQGKAEAGYFGANRCPPSSQLVGDAPVAENAAATGTNPLECSAEGGDASPVTGGVVGGKKKWRRAESNCGPRDYETLALAN